MDRSQFRIRVAQFLRNEDGPTAVEYAVMLALIISVAIGAISSFGAGSGNLWSSNASGVNAAVNGGS